MRAFFKSELETLKIKTGLNQYETLSAHPDAANNIKKLLDFLEAACKHYPMMPDKDKQAILSEAAETDKDFIGWNVKFVRDHLGKHYGKYYREIAHQDKDEVYAPAPPISEETKRMWDEHVAKMEKQWRMSITGVEEAKKQIKLEDFAHLKGRIGVSVASELNRYEIEGQEIFAKSEEEAIEIFANR